MSRFKGLRNALMATGLVVALMSVPTSQAAAQVFDSDVINATALVLGIAPMNVTGVNDLDFGSVIAGGVPGTIADTAANGGRWDVTGEPAYPVSVTFSLPTTLSGPGGTIPISFNATDGINFSTFPTTYTLFNPNAILATALSGTGTLTIGIVGTVTPALGTTTGVYTNTITLTVAYL